MTRLIIWRHGRTAWNSENRVQGQTDVELDAVGREQATLVAPRLAARHPDVIVASDLLRAQQTAEPLGTLTGLPVQLDPRLRERDFGQWQGLSMAEVTERYPEAHARWRAALPVGACGLEEVDDLAKRVAAALQELADGAPDGTVVVATHGGAAKYGVGTLLGWSAPVTRTLGALANCHWIELRSDPESGWRLLSYNTRG
ncbi:MAG: glucosyl-3-phosphoglycerate phosphatase [Micromonosporaceae bacterium]